MEGSGTLVASLLTGLGLAGAAGLNAYIPLLGVAVLGRMHVLSLASPFDVLMHPVAVGALVVLLALGVHATKAAVRPAVNVATLGMGTPVVSLIEDVLSAITTLVAVLVPVLVILLLAGLLWVGLRFARRRRARV